MIAKRGAGGEAPDYGVCGAGAEVSAHPTAASP